MGTRKNKWTDEQLIEAVKNNFSYAEVIRALGLKPAGGNYDTVKRKIKELSLDISHMTGSAWNQGLRSKATREPKKLEDILIENSDYVNTSRLRIRLISEGIKEHRCEKCGLITWQNDLIPIELHHINGVKNDLRLENLQILCPNCHAMTDNYRGKNISNSY